MSLRWSFYSITLTHNTSLLLYFSSCVTMNRKCDDDTIILISLVLRIAYRHSRQPNKRWISLSNDHVKWAKPANVTDPTDSNPYETTTNQARESSRQFVAPNLTTSITCQLQPCTIWRWLAEDGRSIQDICTATTADDEMILSRSHSNGKSSFCHFGVLCRWHFEICMSLVLSRGVGCWCMGRRHAVWMHQVDGGRGVKQTLAGESARKKKPSHCRKNVASAHAIDKMLLLPFQYTRFVVVVATVHGARSAPLESAVRICKRETNLFSIPSVIHVSCII